MYQKTTFKISGSTFVKPLLFSLAAFCISNASIAQQYVNGNLSTGATSKSGVAAPAGYTWSELQNDTGITTVSNTSLGLGAAVSTNFSLADDFVVPAGQSWSITKFTFYAYKTGTTGAVSPFNDLRVVVHSSNPAVGTTTILHGNIDTNVYGTSSDALMYRIGNSLYPTASAPGTTRKIWKIESTPVLLTLPAGTYWVEWQVGDILATGNFLPASTVAGARTQAGYNAVQHNITDAVWAAAVDAGNPATPPSVALDMPFIINYGTLGTESFAKNNIKMYPNPTKGDLNLSWDKNAITSEVDNLQIFDLKGVKVFSKELASLDEISVNISNLNSGVYLLKLIDKSGKEISIKKLIKE